MDPAEFSPSTYLVVCQLVPCEVFGFIHCFLFAGIVREFKLSWLVYHFNVLISSVQIYASLAIFLMDAFAIVALRYHTLATTPKLVEKEKQKNYGFPIRDFPRCSTLPQSFVR